MRIAIITESFPPDVNGVAHSVLRVAEQLVRRGHTPVVIAPAPPSGRRAVAGPLPYPVVRVPSVPLPGYRSFRLGLPSRRLTEALTAFAPDLVHLASPFVLGARGVAVAGQLGLPMVAVYQTDVPAYARAYRLGAAESAAWRWLRAIHNGASRTLAPSTAAATALVNHGIRRVWLWGRGVDTVRFAPAKRSARLRAALAPGGEAIVGYVGRLAVEKRVDLLAAVCRLPGVRVVVVGGGPLRRSLERALPGAVFLGERHGERPPGTVPCTSTPPVIRPRTTVACGAWIGCIRANAGTGYSWARISICSRAPGRRCGTGRRPSRRTRRRRGARKHGGSRRRASAGCTRDRQTSCRTWRARRSPSGGTVTAASRRPNRQR